MKKAMVYVCDKDFFAPSLISCQSFDAKKYEDVDRFIFICTDSDAFIQRASHYCEVKGINVQIRKMDIAVAKDFPLLAHLHQAAYGRLFLHEYLDRSYDRVLYLDGDTLSGPTALNFDECLFGNTLGAVQDIGVVSSGRAAQLLHQNMERGHKYFNSGVLLIDWQLWCKQSIGPRCVTFLNSNVNITYGDQCALNNVCIGKWTDLHPSWNTQTDLLVHPQLVKAARVFHFTGPSKPWQTDLWKHNIEFSNLYEKLLSKHPFDTTFRPATTKSLFKRSLRNIGKKIGIKKQKNWATWVTEEYGPV